MKEAIACYKRGAWRMRRVGTTGWRECATVLHL